MAALPYIQLYVADYLADTAHLSTVEHGAYLLLIMNYWQRGKPLPAKDDRLAKIARMSDTEWLAIKDNILEFFDEHDGLLIHHRIDNDLAAVLEKSTKASKAGRMSAIKRTLNIRSTGAEQTFNHTEADTETEQIQNRKNTAALPMTQEIDVLLKIDPALQTDLTNKERSPDIDRLLKTAKKIVGQFGAAEVLRAWDVLSSDQWYSDKGFNNVWYLFGDDYERAAVKIRKLLAPRNGTIEPELKRNWVGGKPI